MKKSKPAATSKRRVSKRASQSAPAPARPPQLRRISKEHCPIVGFGASAGGLDAFTSLLQEMPADSGMALVLVQHLDPQHSSILTELLSRATSMKVTQVVHETRVQPNRVYVIPPNKDLLISGGVLHLEPRSAGGAAHADRPLLPLAGRRSGGESHCRSPFRHSLRRQPGCQGDQSRRRHRLCAGPCDRPI